MEANDADHILSLLNTPSGMFLITNMISAHADNTKTVFFFLRIAFETLLATFAGDAVSMAGVAGRFSIIFVFTKPGRNRSGPDANESET